MYIQTRKKFYIVSRYVTPKLEGPPPTHTQRKRERLKTKRKSYVQFSKIVLGKIFYSEQKKSYFKTKLTVLKIKY